MKAQTRKPHTVTASVRNAETAANRAEKEADRAKCHHEDATTAANQAITSAERAAMAAQRAERSAYNAFLSADRACTAEQRLRRKVNLNSILCAILILLIAIDVILTHC